MEKVILNYRVIVEQEKQGKKVVYNAYCPSLNVADYGDTIEEVLESIKDGIQLAVECLAEEKKNIPNDNLATQLITAIQISMNKNLVTPA